MSKCIYCLINQNQNNFSNREHVIPQSFGKFNTDNFVLNNKSKETRQVCNDCNNLFGSSIDRWLAKDSYEGYVLRNKYLKNIDSPNIRRVRIKICEGEFAGVNMQFNGKDSVELLPQIGLLNKYNKWEYFLPNEADKIQKENFQLSGKSLLAFQMSDNEAAEVFSKIGIKFVPGELLPRPTQTDLLCKIDANIDLTIRRAVAKIAFNYFTYFNHKKTVLKNNFDEIRNFIHSGKGNHPISINNSAILMDEDKKFKRLGHIIVINVNEYGNIVAQVSLFNELKYTIFIGEANGLDKLNVGFGHFFNVHSKEIHEIQKSSLIIPKTKLIIPEPKIWLPK